MDGTGHPRIGKFLMKAFLKFLTSSLKCMSLSK